MITVTKQAGDFLADAIRQASLNAQAGECFRLTRDGTGAFALKPSIKTKADVSIVHNDRMLLVIAGSIAADLEGRQLDLKQSDEGRPVLVWT